MKAQAEVSLYPLRESNLAEPINEFVEILRNNKVDVRVGSMSSLVVGDSRNLFEGLRKAFDQLAEKYAIFMTLKISNACPDA